MDTVCVFVCVYRYIAPESFPASVPAARKLPSAIYSSLHYKQVEEGPFFLYNLYPFIRLMAIFIASSFLFSPSGFYCWNVERHFWLFWWDWTPVFNSLVRRNYVAPYLSETLESGPLSISLLHPVPFIYFRWIETNEAQYRWASAISLEGEENKRASSSASSHIDLTHPAQIRNRRSGRSNNSLLDVCCTIG